MKCWKCGKELTSYIYEQQHEGWGFANYKTEYFKHYKCMNADCENYRKTVY